MEIAYRTEYGILEVRPTGPLKDEDFKSLGSELEALIDDERTLNGILIVSEEFPGYDSVSDLVSHGRFVGEYRDRIPRVALCTDSPVGILLKALGQVFTEAEVRKFEYDEKDDAEKWLLA